MKKIKLYRVLFLLEALLFIGWNAMMIADIVNVGELRIFDLPFRGAAGYAAGFAMLTGAFIVCTLPLLIAAAGFWIYDRRKRRCGGR